jgi:hypothetical protein
VSFDNSGPNSFTHNFAHDFPDINSNDQPNNISNEQPNNRTHTFASYNKPHTFADDFTNIFAVSISFNCSNAFPEYISHPVTNNRTNSITECGSHPITNRSFNCRTVCFGYNSVPVRGPKCTPNIFSLHPTTSPNPFTHNFPDINSFIRTHRMFPLARRSKRSNQTRL